MRARARECARVCVLACVSARVCVWTVPKQGGRRWKQSLACVAGKRTGLEHAEGVRAEKLLTASSSS